MAEFNPIDYSGGNGFGQGLQLAGMYQQAKQQKAAAEQAQQQQATMQAFQKDWQAAYSSGDPQQLGSLAAKYPGQMETIQKAIGFRDDNHRMALGNAARDLRVAMSSGNPDAVAQAAQAHAGTLGSVGATPQEIVQQFQQDPKGLLQTVDTVGMGALTPEKYFDVQDKSAGRGVTMRGQDIGAATAAQGQAIQMRGQDITANLGQQRLELDRETNRINFDNKRLDREMQGAKNDLQRQEIQQRIDTNNQKLVQQKKEITDGYRTGIDTLTTSMGTLNDVLTSPGLKSITGIRGVIPNIPGTEAANTQAKLETFKSQAFLSAVQSMRGMGALSDAEGKKLDAAVGALQNSQSEGSFKTNGKVIMDMYNKKRSEAVNKYVEQSGIKRVEAPKESIEYLMAHPELSTDFVNRYGYLPEMGK